MKKWNLFITLKSDLCVATGAGEAGLTNIKTALEHAVHISVSYTHLDVYKRQHLQYGSLPGAGRIEGLVKAAVGGCGMEMCIRDSL